jgi:hypothetical protein
MSDLTTLAAVKAYAGVTNANQDDIISPLITAYSDWVREYCNRSFSIESFDIYRSGRGQCAIMLPQQPIVSIQSVIVNNVPLPAQSAGGGFGYRHDGQSLIVDSYAFPWGRSNVRIQFTAGFAAIPPVIAQAVNEIVSLRLANIDHQGWSSKSLAGETVTLFKRDLPPETKTILDDYRLVVPA